MKSVALYNLGCKVNSYELDVIQQILQEKGYKIVPFDEKADIYIVNTCTVTNIADRKSRQILHRARKNNPAAVVVAVGCYVQSGNRVSEDSAVDLVIGNSQKQHLLSILEAYLDGQGSGEEKDGSDYDKSVALTRTASHTRAYIKIQDGCNQFCSYCIIPYVRGRVKSRRMMEIIDEAEGLVVNGYQEIVLTGIHISSYGTDADAPEEKAGLLTLIERLQEIPGLKRIRLGSLEPRIISPEFAARIAKLDKVCPHFHLSLQSGCDATLKRMNRNYTTAEYFQKIGLLRKAYADRKLALTTDIIVGFPGETDTEFEETAHFLRKVSFSEMHIFKYSIRNGTKAAEMPEQMSEKCKKQRSEKLIALNRIMTQEYRESFRGEEVQILIEESKEIAGSRYFTGYTGEYVKAAIAAGDSENIQALLQKGALIRGRVKDNLTTEILLVSDVLEANCGN